MRAGRCVFAISFNNVVFNQVLGRIQLYQYNIPIPVAAWSRRGFESRRRHGCLALGSYVFCQVEVPAMCRSLFQTSPTECGVSECDRRYSHRRPWPTRTVQPWQKKKVWLSSARRRKPWISVSAVSNVSDFEMPHIPHYSQDRYSLSQVIYCESWSLKRWDYEMTKDECRKPKAKCFGFENVTWVIPSQIVFIFAHFLHNESKINYTLLPLGSLVCRYIASRIRAA
jgi:hypothetical protein